MMPQESILVAFLNQMMSNNSEFKIGFFPGNFDLLHLGHLRAFKEAKEHCDFLVVGVKRNNNDLPKKNQPIMSLKDRIEALEAVKYVDHVISYNTEDELHEIDNSLTYAVRFMGEDHKKINHGIVADIVYLKRTHTYSTTNVRKRICELEHL